MLNSVSVPLSVSANSRHTPSPPMPHGGYTETSPADALSSSKSCLSLAPEGVLQVLERVGDECHPLEGYSDSTSR